MRLKMRFKKVIIYSLIIMLLFNFLISAFATKPVFATGQQPATDPDDTAAEEAAAEALVSSRINGPAGILIWVVRLIAMAPMAALQLETFLVANSAGHKGEVSKFVTPLDIFFNRFTLVDVNIFDYEDLNPDGIVYKIRTNSAMFYWIVLTIAGLYMLLELFKIGWKIAIVLGSKDATPEQMKEALSYVGNWLIGVCLVTMMHFLVRGALEINNRLIGIIESVADRADVADVMDSIFTACFSDSYLIGIASTIVYVVMVLQTMIFLGIYIWRFLKITLLVIISPAIAATYTNDMVSTRKALRLEGWFREFLYNLFIQVIHCVIYVTTVGVALNALAEVGSIDGLETLAVAVIAVFSILFVKKAEELLKDLFGFNNAKSLTSYSSVTNSIGRTVATFGAGSLGMAAGAATLATGTTVDGKSMTPFGQNVSNNSGNNANGNQGRMTIRDRLNRFKTLQNPVGVEGASAEDVTENNRLTSGSEAEENANKENKSSQTEEQNEIRDEETNSNTNETNNREQNVSENEEKNELNKIDEAVRSTKHEENTSKNSEETINNEENNSRENNVEEDAENNENADNNENEKNMNTSKFSELYTQMSETISNLQETENALNEKLENLGKNLDKEEANAIRSNIDKLGNEDAKEYVESLGKTPQGEYAKTYLDLLSTQNAISNEEGKLDDLIDSGARAGLIDDKSTEAALLAGGTVGMMALSKLVSEKATTEEGEAIDNTEVMSPEVRAQHEINASAVKDEVIKDKTFGDITKDNANLLGALEGEITIKGDINDEKMREFNIKILNKVRKNSYSQDNFKEAQRRVRKEGKEAMQKLQQFKDNPSVETAKELSPGGKEYAKLMVEAQQAEMIIRAVKVTTQENTNIDKVVSESVTQTSGNVLDNLNNRKKNAMG